MATFLTVVLIAGISFIVFFLLNEVVKMKDRSGPDDTEP